MMSRCTTMRQMSTSCLNILHTVTAHASATVNTIANQSQSCDLALQLMLLPLHLQVSYASDASFFHTTICYGKCHGSSYHGANVITKGHEFVKSFRNLIIIDENRHMDLSCHLSAVLRRELSRISYADGIVCKRCFLPWTRTREMSAYVTLYYRIFDFKICDSQIGGRT